MDQIKSQSMLIARLVVIGVSSAMILLILPLVIGGISEKLLLDESATSFLALFDMVGAAVSSLLMSRFISTVSWRKILYLASVLLILGNLLCVLSDDIALVYGFRFIAGLGAGMGLSIANAGLAMTKDPDRAIAIYVVSALLAGALALRLLPIFTGAHGVNAILFFLVAMSVMIGLLANLNSVSEDTDAASGSASDTDEEIQLAQSTVPVPTILIAAAGILFYFMGTGSVWAYMERLGVSLSLSADYIGSSLSIASLAGGAGGVLAIVLATRFGRLIPATISILLTAVAMFILAQWINAETYLIGAAMILAGWNFSYPYMIGALISADASGRFVPIAASMQLFGFAIGPVLSAIIFGDAVYTESTILGLVCHLMALVLLLPLLMKLERK